MVARVTWSAQAHQLRINSCLVESQCISGVTVDDSTRAPIWETGGRRALGLVAVGNMLCMAPDGLHPLAFF